LTTSLDQFEALNETVWRGLQIAHPWNWELALVSGPDTVGRCSFVDRTYQRMEVYFRPVQGEVDPELILSQHRQPDKNAEITDLPDPPAGYKALLRTYPDMQRTHAAKFFPGANLLAEVAILWPDARDEALETTLLNAIEPLDPNAPPFLWDAFGLCVRAGKRWILEDCKPEVGEIQWTFSQPDIKKRKRPTIMIQRDALPKQMVGGFPTLREFLTSQLPLGSTVRSAEPVNHNTHQGMRLISRSRRSPAATALGLHTLRYDEGWVCDVENRFYHLTMTRSSRDEDICWPDDVTIECCRRNPITEGKL
jgi:hypothetical protein